ncbi:hypothetical protein LWC34_05720 [Kibdelosporangium philippinense]|uniref:Uncharacterized protein n=1 Tax=Kibdelosporangium philippinense TaxID=211113 RepID=A0ABS8Z3B8_9PSEU|nr:hypothetical protein [Kibdelosporangium philippinense]MCE7002330.1 hypothetical protein [Kibdelosporangium philippinense]
MTSTVPWWATALIGIVGTLLGGVVPLSLGLLNRRSERRRLSRAEKLEFYPALIRSANTLARLDIWPAETGDPKELHAAVEEAAENVAFIAPALVTERAIKVLDAARGLADTISAIRSETRPGHSNKVDQRYVQRLTTAVDALRDAVRDFGTASRRDIEIATPYLPLHSTDSERKA